MIASILSWSHRRSARLSAPLHSALVGARARMQGDSRILSAGRNDDGAADNNLYHSFNFGAGSFHFAAAKLCSSVPCLFACQPACRPSVATCWRRYALARAHWRINFAAAGHCAAIVGVVSRRSGHRLWLTELVGFCCAQMDSAAAAAAGQFVRYQAGQLAARGSCFVPFRRAEWPACKHKLLQAES